MREQFPKQIPYEKFSAKHKVYIFGHSLDITDKDVLRNLILNDNVYTTIYYLNKVVMGQQIANLVKVIGQDELIRQFFKVLSKNETTQTFTEPSNRIYLTSLSSLSLKIGCNSKPAYFVSER